MKKIVLFLTLAILLSGIAYATYLYIQELNPSWERRAGLSEGYKTAILQDNIEGTYSYQSKTGTMRLILSKDKRYEIYLMRKGANYLYSKGTCDKVVDESVFPEQTSYRLKSEAIEGRVGEFRFRHHEMKGRFLDLQKKEALIKYYVHFPKKGLVCETWEFIGSEDGLWDMKTNKIYREVSTKTAKALKAKNSKKPKSTIALNASTKERHTKADIVPTNIQKIKNKVESVYDCKGGYGAMTVRLVILSGMTFQVHIVEDGRAFLYSKGVYADGRRISLNGTEIAREYAAYRFEKHAYHGTFVNDTGSEDGMKAIRRIGDVWKAKIIFETWVFSKTGDGNLLDVNDKKLFVYNKNLSEWNMAAVK